MNDKTETVDREEITISPEVVENMKEIMDRWFTACDLLQVLRTLEPREDEFNEGHEAVVEITNEKLQGMCDPLDGVQTALNMSPRMHPSVENAIAAETETS